MSCEKKIVIFKKKKTFVNSYSTLETSLLKNQTNISSKKKNFVFKATKSIFEFGKKIDC